MSFSNNNSICTKEQYYDDYFYNHFLRLKVLEKKLKQSEIRQQQMDEAMKNAKRDAQEPEKLVPVLFYPHISFGNQLPVFQMPNEIPIVCTDKNKVASRWFEEEVFARLRKGEQVVLGMDLEWDLVKFTQQGTYYHPHHPDVIQFATEKSCLILQVFGGRIAPFDSVLQVFCEPRIKKVFINYVNDIQRLDKWISKHKTSFCLIDNLVEFGFVDLDTQLLGASFLCEHYLQARLEKDEHTILSRWSRKRLDEQQRMYAALDAYLNVILVQSNLKIDDQVQVQWQQKLKRSMQRKFVLQ